METNKIKLNVGSMEFQAEGDKDWVSAQLDKIIASTARSITGLSAGLPALEESERSSYKSPDFTVEEPPTLTFFPKEIERTSKSAKTFIPIKAWLEAKQRNRLKT